MTETQWQELYKSAVLELNPLVMRTKINIAMEAMRERDEQLRQLHDPNALDERRAIADAVHNLTTLEKLELRSAPSDGGRSSTRQSGAL